MIRNSRMYAIADLKAVLENDPIDRYLNKAIFNRKLTTKLFAQALCSGHVLIHVTLSPLPFSLTSPSPEAIKTDDKRVFRKDLISFRSKLHGNMRSFIDSTAIRNS